MEQVLNWLVSYKYPAMLGLLTLCGVGLPVPEELTLLSSGLLCGWNEANFFLSSLCCATGILLGDSIIFGLGHVYGQRFLSSRPMRLLLPAHRQARVIQFFASHGDKALFFARFFPGVRIGVYAYAGSIGVSWRRFIALDGGGVLLSAPTSILVGHWAAKKFANDRSDAILYASQLSHRLGRWAVMGIVAAGLLVLLLRRLQLRRRFAHRAEPRITVAIDGPAGAGKSTVARQVAQRLGFVLVDTGALYRTVALLAVEQQVDWQDEAQLGRLASQLKVHFEAQADGTHVQHAGRDITAKIRTAHISRGASVVSQHPSVRAGLLGQQRSLARAGNAVLEGRDIGTVVCPEAQVKFFLDASDEVRAQRRYDELKSRGEAVELSAVLAEQAERDALDRARDVSPLRPAPDATLLDSTSMVVEDVIETIVRAARQAQGRQGGSSLSAAAALSDTP
jgi:cytidylate kinase